MARDWTSIVAKARRLIAKNGAEVTLVGKSTTLIDATDPSRGYNPASSSTKVTSGVYVHPVGFASLGITKDQGSLLAKCASILLVAPVEGFDMAEISKVIDGGKDHLVETVETLRPGGTDLLYYVGLKR